MIIDPTNNPIKWESGISQTRLREQMKKMGKEYLERMQLDMNLDRDAIREIMGRKERLGGRSTAKELKRKVQAFEARYQVYKEFLELSGSDEIAGKFAFGSDYTGENDPKDYLENLIITWGEQYLNQKLQIDSRNYRQSVEKQLGETYFQLPEEVRGLVNELDRIRQQEMDTVNRIYARSWKKLNGFDERREAIRRKYQVRIAVAKNLGNELLEKQLNRQMNQEIFETSEEYLDYFSRIGCHTLGRAIEVQQEVGELLNQVMTDEELTPEQRQEIVARLETFMQTEGAESESLLKSAADSLSSEPLLKGLTDFEKSTGTAVSALKSLQEEIKKLIELFKESGDTSTTTSEETLTGLEKMDAAYKKLQEGLQGYNKIFAVLEGPVGKTLTSMSSLTKVGGEMADALGNEKAAARWGVANEAISIFSGTFTSLSKAVKEGDIMGAVTEIAMLPMKLVTVFAKFHDKKLDLMIKESQAQVKALKNEYTELERTISRSLKGAKYTMAKDQVENLRKQKEELEKQLEAEQGKKKQSKDAIANYQKEIAEAEHNMLLVVEGVRKDILGGSIADTAEKLGNAFLEAFSKGEDAAAAFTKEVDKLVQGVIKKMLLTSMIEQPLAKILNKYVNTWMDKEGKFAGEEYIMESAAKMGDELKGFSTGLEKMMESLPDDVKKYLFPEVDNKNSAKGGSLSNAIAGITENTANLLGGYLNSIHGNVSSILVQFEELNPLVTDINSILGQSLVTQLEISANTLRSAVGVDRLIDIFDGVTNPIGVKKLNIR